MAPRRRCPTCGSKQWHKEPLSGLVACSEGHVLQNYRNETTEITEVGPHAMKKRTLKSGRKKKDITSQANPKLYHKARGRYHYFLCLQLILRKQIVALTKLWELPSEFEIICRDLWALNLALLPDPPPAEPYHHAQKFKDDPEEEGGGKDAPKSSDRKGKGKQRDLDSGSEEDEEEDEGEKRVKREDNSDDEDEEEEEEEEEEDEDEDEIDTELEAMMQENSELSDSSEEGEVEGEQVAEGQQDAGKKKARKRRGHVDYESPMSTIAVLVVGCWTLRIPVMYRDFTRIIERYEIPYLDGVRKLPGSMAEHLTKHYIQALSPPHAPGTMAMHGVASRLAKKLNENYGIYTPEVNGAALLWRITKEMGGTPVLYRLTKRVAGVLSIPLTLHWTLSMGIEGRGGRTVMRRQYDSVPPEVGLLGALIIVVKMVHGLDGKTRRIDEEDAVGCGLGSAKAYMRAIGKRAEKESGNYFDTQHELAVGNMGESEMDEYIGFCAEILGRDGEWAGMGVNDESDGPVDRFFGRVDGTRRATVPDEGVTVPHEGVTVQDEGLTVPDSDGDSEKETESEKEGEHGELRAGQDYKIWNSMDVDGSVPPEYLAVIEHGERTVGMKIGGMLAAFERRLVGWKGR